MNRMKANDFYLKHNEIGCSLNKLHNDVVSRLKFLINKHKDVEEIIELNESISFTIKNLYEIDIVNSKYPIEDLINYIDAIEKWISRNDKIIQLSMFD